MILSISRNNRQRYKFTLDYFLSNFAVKGNIQKMSTKKNGCFTQFNLPIEGISLPKKFTFPFYYEPHPLAILAAEQLQDYLEKLPDNFHNFGIKNPNNTGAIGKMFGVLVVENKSGEIGFISAFSGLELGDKTPNLFVPNLFDANPNGGFYTNGAKELNRMTEQIEHLEQQPEILSLKEKVKKETEVFNKKIEVLKAEQRAAKLARKQKRTNAKTVLLPSDYNTLLETLGKESISIRNQVRDTEIDLQKGLDKITAPLLKLEHEISNLKAARKEKSVNLQQSLFSHYRFLNIKGEEKNLHEIFKDTPKPSGAGECAAPKLLQFAFMNQLKPIALTEFWWGKSPASAVRRHRQHYHACMGKCKPILSHMLTGLELDDDPMLVNPAQEKELPILYEDDHLVLVNKPSGLLSTPGKFITDSVQARMHKLHPEVNGAMMIHRLDMHTSGILLLTKNPSNHKFLQRQFVNRTIKKRYVALLEGIVDGEAGRIDLPLSVDFDNRPHQMISYEHGRSAITDWKVIERTSTHTKVYFYPLTGRSHQLRIHAAHPLGLGCPIVGDDLYGLKADRLCLHAEQLEFYHPISKERMLIEVEAGF